MQPRESPTIHSPTFEKDEESGLSFSLISTESLDSMGSSSAIRTTWTSYTDSTTLHGVPYIQANHRCDRLLWLAIVLTAIAGAIIGSMLAYNDWKNQPVITSLETTGIDFIMELN